MNKILKLIIDDYQNHKPSAEYQLALHRYCEAEQEFMAMLNKKQTAKYLKLNFAAGELSVVEQDEFAINLLSILQNL